MTTFIPPPRILYTDVNGGQILGYTEEDMREAAGLKPQIALKLTPRQRQTVEAMMIHGTLKGAAKALGVQENSVKKALQSARVKAGATSTLQLCLMYSGKEHSS